MKKPKKEKARTSEQKHTALPKILLVGRSCSGKDSLSKELSNILNVKMVCSHTTRPMRSYEVNGKEHYFVSKHTFDKLRNKSNVIAYTRLYRPSGIHKCLSKVFPWAYKNCGYEYMTTEDEFKESGIYIIDPGGIDFLMNHTDEECVIVYTYTGYHVRELRSIYRADVDVTDNKALSRIQKEFKKRDKEEDVMFSDFESMIYDYNHGDSTICHRDRPESAVDTMVSLYKGKYRIITVRNDKDVSLHDAAWDVVNSIKKLYPDCGPYPERERVIDDELWTDILSK